LLAELRGRVNDFSRWRELQGAADAALACLRWASVCGGALPDHGERLCLLDAKHPLLLPAVREGLGLEALPHAVVPLNLVMEGGERADMLAATVIVLKVVDGSREVVLTDRARAETPRRLERLEAARLETLRARLAGVPGVQGMAATFSIPLWANYLRTDFVRSDQSDGRKVNLTIRPVDFGYFGVYRLPLLAGRDFSRDFAEDKVAADDKSRLSAAIINETALRKLGFTDPSAAIGQKIKTTDSDFARNHRVIGVAPDFPLDSIRTRVPPAVFVVDPDMFKVLSVKLSGSNLPETLRGVDAAWHEVVPAQRISRVFLDDRIAELNVDIARQGALFTAFAACAVALGCLGMIGLSAYTAERRTKEIGIRKALGANNGKVIALLVWDFIRPVLLANLIAWPVAFYFLHRWLSGFVYHVPLSPLVFVGASAFAILVALLTVAAQSVWTARQKPVLALRYE